MRSFCIAVVLAAALAALPPTRLGAQGPVAPAGRTSRPEAGQGRRSSPPLSLLRGSPWGRRVDRLLILVGLVLIAATALLLVFERRLVFFPARDPVSGWQPAGLGVEECSFHAKDGVQLYGWWHLGRDGGDALRRPVILWCHGNAGNITHREENLRMLADRGLAVLIFDYRGYGKSEGTPSEEGLYLDAEAAYDYLVKERGVDPARIVCFGRSLGAAVALHLALKENVAGLIMESPFKSIPAMARRQFPFVPAWLFVRTRFDNVARIGGLRVPLLVVHGDRDDLVPLTHGKAVFDAAPEPKQLYIIAGAGHNDTYDVGGEAYFRTVVGFCHRRLDSRAEP